MQKILTANEMNFAGMISDPSSPVQQFAPITTRRGADQTFNLYAAFVQQMRALPQSPRQFAEVSGASEELGKDIRKLNMTLKLKGTDDERQRTQI